MDFTAHGIVESLSELGLRSLTQAKFVKPVAAIEQRPNLSLSQISLLVALFRIRIGP
jgi:hypothetical protein